MFAKQTTNQSKKDKASTSTATERCEPPRVSTGGGDWLRRRRESSATPARTSSADISRNFNDQSEIGEVSYNLQVIDGDTGRRITRQYNRIANDVPINITDYNSHDNIYNLHGNWGGPSKIYLEIINNMVVGLLSEIRKPNERTEPILCDPKFSEPKKNRNRNQKPKPINSGRFGFGVRGPRIGPKEPNF